MTGEFSEWNEDEFGVIPLFQRMSWLVIGVALISMLTAVLTVINRKSMLPMDIEKVTTTLSLLLMVMSIGAAIFFAATMTGSLHAYHESRISDMTNTTVEMSPFVGKYSDDKVLVIDPDVHPGYVTRIEGDISATYYPGPAWFFLMIGIPAFAYATHYYQSRENAGEEETIGDFFGNLKEKLPKGDKSKDGSPAIGLGMGATSLSDKKASRQSRLSRKAKASGRGAPIGMGGHSRPGKGDGSQGPKVRGKSDPEFLRVVAEYKRFTGKTRLSSNELAKLRAMAKK